MNTAYLFALAVGILTGVGVMTLLGCWAAIAADWRDEK